MIKVTVSYPGGEGITFDHDYYAGTHVPMCAEAFKPARIELERGLNGPNLASVAFYFESMESMQAAMSTPKMGDILADLGNYTNSSPTMQVSELVD